MAKNYHGSHIFVSLVRTHVQFLMEGMAASRVGATAEAYIQKKVNVVVVVVEKFNGEVGT